ncbi:major facilitator super transporter protein [Dipsacomyces acuminosporus]|nr:major facilitator super transporter protein [Dipsacomyces acuminosporus]
MKGRIGLLLMLLLVELVGLGFFAKGFFPYKKSIAGFATTSEQRPWDLSAPDLDKQPSTEETEGRGAPRQTAQYDRLVVMLVDALRNDFVFGNSSAMDFTQGLLRGGHAIGYTAKALAPTVTMPRIKALMTGTVPNFLDAVLNIAESDTSSSLRFHDNLLWQLKNHGGKSINMFGDDTWLRLFPELFTRTDGTSSFFVTDTVEVDLNVTRHVRPELEKDDWDVAIFHYLGLDHIGHLAGPSSPLMKPKQREMDKVVKDVFEIVTRKDEERMSKDSSAKPTLFVLLGDHAMNEIGNHGGNSKLETSTVFVFMGHGIQSKKIADEGKNALSALLAKEVPQIDLVPTLALLFGVPIPKNNLGLPLPELLKMYSEKERLELIQTAAHQIFQVVCANDPSLERIRVAEITSQASTAKEVLPACDSVGGGVGSELRCRYLRALRAHRLSVFGKLLPGSAVREYYDFMEHANEHLSRTFSGYNLEAMVTGILIIGIAAIGLLLLHKSSSASGGRASTAEWLRSAATTPAAGLLATYLFSLSSSSLIEEEHQFWYFWVQTMLVLRLLTSGSKDEVLRSFLQMCLFRVARAWNQTGQKWTGEIDIRYYLNSSHIRQMWLSVLLAVLFVNVCIYRLHIYLYPRPSRARIQDIANSRKQPHSRASKGTAHRMAYRRGVRGEEPQVVTLYSGVETSEQRRLILGQRVLRALVGYASLCALLYQLDRNHGWRVLGIGEAYWNILRKCAPPELSDVARMVYMCTGVSGVAGAVCAWYRVRSGFAEQETGEVQLSAVQAAVLDTLAGCMPLLILLTRPHNIPLFAIFMLIFALFFQQLRPLLWIHGGWIKDDAAESTDQPDSTPSIEGGDKGQLAAQTVRQLRPTKELTQFCILNASFFVLGNSNSLASLDLSNAYAGVSRYNEGLVGLLLFISNWAGPLWWAIAVLSTLSLNGQAQPASRWRRRILDSLVAAHVWQAFTLLMLSIIVTSLRTHLFIWSVFSPRYLYQIGWFVGFYLASVTGTGLLWLFGYAPSDL